MTTGASSGPAATGGDRSGRGGRSGRAGQIDALRGVAALTVFLTHIVTFLPAAQDVRPASRPLRYVLNTLSLAGHEAVILFFVLSGFVLYLALEGGRTSPASFIVKRVFRIYPALWLSLLLCVACISLVHPGRVPGYSAEFNRIWTAPVSAPLLLQNLLLMGNFDPLSYNGVIWSLVDEMRISLVFPVLAWLLMRGHDRAVLAGTGIIAVVSAALYVRLPGGASYFASAYYIYMFAIGAILAKHRAWVMARFTALAPGSRALLVLAGLLAYTYPSAPVGSLVSLLHLQPVDDAMTVAGGALLVVAALTSRRVLLMRPFPFLGRISYSFYLFQIPVLVTAIHLFGTTTAAAVIDGASLIVLVVLADVVSRLVEAPMITTGRRLAHMTGFKEQREIAGRVSSG